MRERERGGLLLRKGVKFTLGGKCQMLITSESSRRNQTLNIKEMLRGRNGFSPLQFPNYIYLVQERRKQPTAQIKEHNNNLPPPPPPPPPPQLKKNKKTKKLQMPSFVDFHSFMVLLCGSLSIWKTITLVRLNWIQQFASVSKRYIFDLLSSASNFGQNRQNS